MSIESSEAIVEKKRTPLLSVDVWAVLLAFVLALLVRAGLLQHVTW